jgi:hypothetical protein
MSITATDYRRISATGGRADAVRYSPLGAPAIVVAVDVERA